MLNIAALILPLAFLPGLISAGLAPRWWVLAVLVPFLLWNVDFKRIAHGKLTLAFLAYAMASLLWEEVWLDGVMELWHLALLLGVFAVGASYKDVKGPLIIMSAAVSITLPLVVLQKFGYWGIAQLSPPAGLFANKNVLAESAAALFVAMMYMRHWWLAAALASIVALTGEKAAFISIAVCALVYFWPRSWKVTTVIICSIVGSMLYLTGSISATSRFDIWLDSIKGFSVFGNGLGSFYSIFPENAELSNLLVTRPEYAHNEFIQFFFELGIGTFILLPVGYFALSRGSELERLVLIAILVESLFAFPLHMPVTGFIAALMAGSLCRIEPNSDFVEHSVGTQNA